MKLRKLLIVDGYTDEPAGLGVPPYLDVYPREAYGAMKVADPGNEVRYVTIDWVRRNWHGYAELTKWADLVLVVAGALVPGKYLGGEPLRDPHELERLVAFSDAPLALAGPAASLGLGGIGGTVAKEVEGQVIKVRGRVAHWIFTAAKDGIEKAEDVLVLEDYELVDKALVKGAEVVLQHPNLRVGNLIVEIETFEGCPRAVSGGCSFCMSVLRPRLQRKPESIVAEVEALYALGVRALRLGRQSDILVYGSDMNVEWPKPEPATLEKLFRGIRHVAPSLMTLHIDNVNPGTVARWERESLDALKVIVKYHTPGDVAALGVESVDPRVVKINNLKVDFEGALKAVEVINKVGGARGWNGLPHLLPGINFIAGLPGESKETWEWNVKFLEEVEKRGLLVRRVNVRKLSVLPGTRVSRMIKEPRVSKGYGKFRKYVMEWQKRMMGRILPKGTIIYNLMVEKTERGISYARQPASYPITVEIPGPLRVGQWVRARVKRHHARSVVAEVI